MATPLVGPLLVITKQIELRAAPLVPFPPTRIIDLQSAIVTPRLPQTIVSFRDGVDYSQHLQCPLCGGPNHSTWGVPFIVGDRSVGWAVGMEVYLPSSPLSNGAVMIPALHNYTLVPFYTIRDMIQPGITDGRMDQAAPSPGAELRTPGPSTRHPTHIEEMEYGRAQAYAMLNQTPPEEVEEVIDVGDAPSAEEAPVNASLHEEAMEETGAEEEGGEEAESKEREEGQPQEGVDCLWSPGHGPPASPEPPSTASLQLQLEAAQAEIEALRVDFFEKIMAIKKEYEEKEKEALRNLELAHMAVEKNAAVREELEEAKKRIETMVAKEYERITMWDEKRKESEAEKAGLKEENESIKAKLSSMTSMRDHFQRSWERAEAESESLENDKRKAWASAFNGHIRLMCQDRHDLTRFIDKAASRLSCKKKKKDQSATLDELREELLRLKGKMEPALPQQPETEGKRMKRKRQAAPFGAPTRWIETEIEEQPEEKKKKKKKTEVVHQQPTRRSTRISNIKPTTTSA